MADRARDFFKIDIDGLRPLRGARTAEWTALSPRGLSLRATLNKDGTIGRAWGHRYTKPSGGAGRLVHGHWPEMSVEDAVAAHKAARALLDAGLDPATARAEEKRRLDGRTTVAQAFDDYVAEQSDALAEKTLKEYQRLIKGHVIEAIGSMAIADVTPAIIKDLLRQEMRKFKSREDKRVAAAVAKGEERVSQETGRS